jgi:SAM-dependent methyltransferase
VCVGPSGRVIGLDLNEGMLAVARRLRPEIDWRQGDALDLPFAERAFDVVVSQFALMFFPDRPLALREMWRVLAPGGRLAVAVCAPLEETKGYGLFADILRREAGEDAAAIVEGYFALGDEAELLRLARAAGHRGSKDSELRGLGALRLDRGVRAHRDQRLAARRTDRRDRLRGSPDRGAWALAEFRDDSGQLAIPLGARILIAGKR